MAYNLATKLLEECLEQRISCIQIADHIIIYRATKNIKSALKCSELIKKSHRDYVILQHDSYK